MSLVLRCLAKRDNLDGSPPIPRHHEHTRLVMQSLSSNELWKKYGIVNDILVSLKICRTIICSSIEKSYSLLLQAFQGQIFMS